jgi:uncharacterized membrane protein HdeD (DUF308 family)
MLARVLVVLASLLAFLAIFAVWINRQILNIGIAIIAWPDESVTVYATLAGVYLILRALLKAALAFSMRSASVT